MTTGYSDELLLQHWRNGDLRAGRHLFDRYYERIVRLVVGKTSPNYGDLVRDVFWDCLNVPAKLWGRASVRVFIFAATCRRLVSQPSVSCRLHLDSHLLHPILRALRRLPVRTQAMLELYYRESLSIDDLALVFDQSVAAIRSSISEGQRQLARRLADLSHQPSAYYATILDSSFSARLRRTLSTA